MSQNSTLYLESPRELFSSLLSEVMKERSYILEGASHAYVLSVLEKHVFEKNPFKEFGSKKMLMESYLEALKTQDDLSRQRKLLLLGEGILFRSGFFAGSFKRKIVGLGYYIDMGSRTYEEAFVRSKNSVHKDLAERFSAYVDLFSNLGEKMNFSGDREGADVLLLFDRFLQADSEDAKARLMDLGVSFKDLKKASNQ